MSKTDENREPPEILQPEIVGVEEVEDAEPIIDFGEETETETEAIQEIDEAMGVEKEKKPKPAALGPPTTKRSSTTKRPPTTKRPRTTRAAPRSARDRASDRTPTQGAGTRRLPRGKDQRAKLVVMAATAGLLLLLIVLAISHALRKPPPKPKNKIIYIQHQLDLARGYRREGEALIRQAASGTTSAKNSFLKQAEGKLRKAQAEYMILTEKYKGSDYTYLQTEASKVQMLIYHCMKSRTL